MLVSCGYAKGTETVGGCITENRANKKLVDKKEYMEPLECTQYTMDAAWWDLPPALIQKIPPDRLKESAQGVLKVLQSLVPSFAMCDARDIGGACFGKEKALRR